MFYYEKEYSDANIKCDYDTNRNPFSIKKVISVLKTNPLKNIGFYPYEGYVFSTKKGFHLRIWYSHKNEWIVDFSNNREESYSLGIKKIPAHSILRVQKLLNDVPQRQIFNRIRVRRGEPCWNILWNCKIRNGVIVSKEELHESYSDILMHRHLIIF